MHDVVTIVGTGAVGSVLAAHATSCIGRSELDAWFDSLAHPGTALSGSSGHPGIVILALPPHAIHHCALRLALVLKSQPADIVVMHTNGTLGLDVLSCLREVGGKVSAAHPFQTFGIGVPTSLSGIGWGVECDDEAWEPVCGWIERTGGKPMRFVGWTQQQRLMYHAVAVAASNHVYAPIDLARRLSEQLSLPVGQFLIPILEQAIANAKEALLSGGKFPVTGPLARGEHAIVEEQLSALPPSEQELYRLLTMALSETLTHQQR